SRRRRHTRCLSDWSSDVCSSDLPFQGDRRHFSHRLVERGLTPPQAVRTIDLVTLAGGLGALLLHRLSAAGTCVVVAQTVCLLGRSEERRVGNDYRSGRSWNGENI